MLSKVKASIENLFSKTKRLTSNSLCANLAGRDIVSLQAYKQQEPFDRKIGNTYSRTVTPYNFTLGQKQNIFCFDPLKMALTKQTFFMISK